MDPEMFTPSEAKRFERNYHEGTEDDLVRMSSVSDQNSAAIIFYLWVSGA